MKTEFSRYNRQELLEQLGKSGQNKLRKAKVLVVGAGGLGCPALQYLAGAGVGTIGIIDHDIVEVTNLQRQTLFGENDAGKNKALCAAERLRELNSEIKFIPYPEQLTSENIRKLIPDYDVIIDGTDNLSVRYLINDACVLSGKPFVFGALHKYSGQVTVFNYPDAKGRKVNYRDVFPVPPSVAISTCDTAGVLGPVAGITGSIQAAETIKIITGIGNIASGFMLQFNILDWSFIKWDLSESVKRNDAPESWEKIEAFDYDNFVSVRNISFEITADDLTQMIQNEENFQLLDVRETWEADEDPVEGAINIPLPEILSQSKTLDPAIKTIVFCASGKRSQTALRLLRELGFTGIYQFKGGLKEWKTARLKLEI